MNILYLLNLVIVVVANEIKGDKSNKSVYSLLEQNVNIKSDLLGDTDKKSNDEELENESIRFNTTKIVVGLEYLGSGYDIVKANTVGDSDQGEDLGYRAPVIEFTWAQTDVGVTNSLDSLQPIGGWVRPKVSCGESENVTEIQSMSKLKELAEADVGVDVNVTNIGTGSLNTQYHNLKDNSENKNNKLYTNTYYCFTYAAGIPPTLDWTTSQEFKISVSELPKKLKNYDDCNLKAYKERKRVCKDIFKWMEFFNEFGTHVVTQIHLGLGGKLTRYLSVPSSMIESLSKEGYDVNMVIGAVISGVSGELSLGVSEDVENEIQKIKKSSKLKFSVLGGIHPNKDISESSIRKWKSTVPKYPMPIKIDLSSISTFLPKGYYNSFKKSMNFYISLNKVFPLDIEQKENRMMSLNH